PLAFCELHHLWHWIDGGSTSLHNSTHLCVRHHQLVHKKGWIVTRHPDGSSTFTDPADHTTSTWQPPVTLTDFIQTTNSPAPLAILQPLTSGPDIACQPATPHITTMRIAEDQRGDGTQPASSARWVWKGTTARADSGPVAARS